MNKPDRIFAFTEPPVWANPSTESHVLAKIKKDDSEPLDGVVFLLNKRVLNTSNKLTEDYDARAIRINSFDSLQEWTSNEFIIKNNEQVLFHRLFVIRENAVLDKLNDTNIQIFDAEDASRQNVISNLKKIHWIVKDIQIGDIFFMEFTIANSFLSDAELDKKFFHEIHILPPPNWFIKEYSLKVINNRKEPIVISQKKFGPDDKKSPIQRELIHTGETYVFERTDYVRSEDTHAPQHVLDISTKSSWNEISSEIYQLCSKVLDENLTSSEISKIFNGIDTIDNKIRRAIEFVQNNISYVYDANVMHGHIPQAGEITISLKMGDCKAKSLMLVKLLRFLGVEAGIILVNYAQDYYLQFYEPSPFAFNHAIVKIRYKDNDYFVDPTWNNRCGLLENRSEPAFSYYLPIRKNTFLQKRTERVPIDFNLEEETRIQLRDSANSIETKVTCKRETADYLRSVSKTGGKKALADLFATETARRLQLSESKQTASLVKESEYNIVSDDLDNNCLQLIAKAKLFDPYTPASNGRVFRYHRVFNFSSLTQNPHLTVIHSSLVFPIKSILHIETTDFIRRKDIVSTRETEIDNKYFYFSNKKNFTSKTVTVESIYKPKNYDYVSLEDLEIFKRDCLEMNKNFGIGIHIIKFWQYFAIYKFIIFIIILRIILLFFESFAK